VGDHDWCQTDVGFDAWMVKRCWAQAGVGGIRYLGWGTSGGCVGAVGGNAVVG